MATVLIWNNDVVLSKHKVVGHSALNITDTWVDGAGENSQNYVSWWPGDQEKEIFGKGAGKKFGVVASCFLEDIKDESGYAPDHVIRIPSANLDKKAMLAKWSEIRSKENAHYRYYRKNCSTVVARVLRAGTKSGSGWHRHSTIWTPLKVKRFAYDMGGYDIGWISFAEEIAKFVSGKEAAALRYLKRRSSAHGSSGAAAPRFAGGKDTGKFNPYAPTYHHDSKGNLLSMDPAALTIPT